MNKPALYSLAFKLRRILILCFTCLVSLNGLTAHAQTRAPVTFYVSPQGNGQGGLTEQTAFHTINAASAAAKVPGDTVLVKAGTYTLQNSPQDQFAYQYPVVYISNSGTSNAYITFKAYPGDRPIIKSLGNINAVVFDAASFVVFEGFEIVGNRPDDSPAGIAAGKAELCNRYNSSPATNDAQSSGILIQPFSGDQVNNLDKPSHHIVLRNNIIRNFGGSGIQTLQADYITVEGNVIYGNAFYNPYAASGISLYQQQDIEPNPAPGQLVKNIIRGNIVYGNKNVFGTAITAGNDSTNCNVNADITDGNGIIFDDSWHNQSKVPSFNGRHYVSRTRIENNVVYGNGARGINVYSSSYVDVVNNTLYQNGQTQIIDPTRYSNAFSEVSSFDSDHVTYFNNIISAIPGKSINLTGATYNNQPGTNRYDYNLVFGGGKFDPQSGTNNLLGKDPLFSNTDVKDFSLQAGSPAIDSGASSVNGVQAAVKDLMGVARPQGNGFDIGTFEFKSASASLANGNYLITNACNGKALGIQNGNPNPSDNVVVQDAGTDGAINWQLTADSNGTYALKVPNTNSVMQAANAATSSETNVDLWSDWGGAPQRWNITSIGSGLYQLTLAAMPSLALDLKYSGQGGESNVWLYNINNTCAQSWKLQASGQRKAARR